MYKLDSGLWSTPLGEMTANQVKDLKDMGVWNIRKYESKDGGSKQTTYSVAFVKHNINYEKINDDATIDLKKAVLPIPYYNVQWFLFLCNGKIDKAISMLRVDPMVYLPARESVSSYSKLFKIMEEAKTSN